MENAQHQTPLAAAHHAIHGRMVDFAGWDLPVMYRGILEEARAVRSDVGIFDISHMGRLKVRGDGAANLLQATTTNDINALSASEAHYSLLTNPEGGIIDDIIIYRENLTSFLVVLNAGNAAKDIAWLRAHAATNVDFEDQTPMTAMIAVQG